MRGKFRHAKHRTALQDKLAALGRRSKAAPKLLRGETIEIGGATFIVSPALAKLLKGKP